MATKKNEGPGVFDKGLDGRSAHDLALDILREYCKPGKKVLVAFSGGKDSQCIYHLCQEAGVEFTAQYSVTRFEPPELWRFIREAYPDVELWHYSVGPVIGTHCGPGTVGLIFHSTKR